MIFNNRLHAAGLLLEKLMKYRSPNLVVLAVPRGAVPMGVLIARGLSCPMTLAPVRKVASPLAPEFALGAADIEGNFYPEDEAMQLPQEQLRLWLKKSLDVLRQREFRWKKRVKSIDLRNKKVILVDDGVATGATMRAALMWARRKQPSELIVAVPVSARESMTMMMNLADHVECLYLPAVFSSVGEFYTTFEEISDEQVCQLLSAFQGDEKAV
jgi:predicted phosphoribosyltransferase